MSLYEHLKNRCQDDWNAYIQHDFVRQLGQGTLAKECFQHYLKQDYLFLTQFSRAWGLAIFKSEDLDSMRYAQAGLNAMLDTEIGLHVQYCTEWGITAAELQSLPEAAATVAYTRYVLDAGFAGDLLDLHVALAPCIIGYAEIAQWLAKQPDTLREGNPYNAWIEMYLSDEYQQAARVERELLDKLGQDLPPARLSSLEHRFRTATRMEVSFWQMGLDLAD
ncbi:thiaminase II [Marinobacterium sediminicola]|uniref:Aminopyrimidine aminohydrolase n=1 Tax=Marinobacterium sediminicola TaxID=518898 RepID=A0ABY1S3S9_9GAMM|nr:thiaminase II [Marinobacterium sediminicola]ULG69203.1 thiaminase II [Marinobacterium sediminicola]SMR78288.1 thiaminase (transcriptional activator TenA) [Marinobacterium sediminicola]